MDKHLSESVEFLEKYLPRTISLKMDGAQVRLEYINQCKLPNELEMKSALDYTQIIDAIKVLEIRGAPAIGIAGASAIAIWCSMCAQDSKTKFSIENLWEVCAQVSSARPTAINLIWAVNKVRDYIIGILDGATMPDDANNASSNASNSANKTLNNQTFSDCDISDLSLAAYKFVKGMEDADIETNVLIGQNGASIFSDSATILTHCNAGSLATVYFGTALGVIYTMHMQGKIERVYSDETRPVNQGSRLTCWELSRVGVPTTLLCDDMSSSLMQTNSIDAVIVGADRIAANGDTANKIGTYSLAISAKYHNVPFYVAAPISTFDFSQIDGSQIPIENREANEVLGDFLLPISVYNPAFDITPHSLITGFITEKGVFSASELKNIQCK